MPDLVKDYLKPTSESLVGRRNYTMTLPYESYWAVVKTSEFLKELMGNTKMGKDAIRKQARDLLKHYPFDFDVEMWIKNNEKVMCEWGKPKASEKNYIAIGRHDPVEYSPKHGGWIFWDETWAQFHGPFVSEAACQAALVEYCKELDGEEKAQETKAEKAEEKRRNALLETNAMSPPELKEMVAKVKKSLAKKAKKTKVKK
jgi:cell division protein FtsB